MFGTLGLVYAAASVVHIAADIAADVAAAVAVDSVAAAVVGIAAVVVVLFCCNTDHLHSCCLCYMNVLYCYLHQYPGRCKLIYYSNIKPLACMLPIYRNHEANVVLSVPY